MPLHFPERLVALLQTSTEYVESTGCIEWKGRLHKGYGVFRDGADPITGRGLTYTTSRAVWVLHNGDIPECLVVRHKCDNRACINIQHLELGTRKDNSLDCVRRGRHPLAKLNEAKVSAIRMSYDTVPELAKEYAVSQQQIRNIQTFRNWRYR